MKAPREDVTIYQYLDGKLVDTRIDKNRVVQKMKDGTERIRMLKGYRTITRVDGKAVFHWYTRTIQAMNIREWVAKVKETGGAIVVLPP
jgi:uncharacterized protein (DUF433 family)